MNEHRFDGLMSAHHGEVYRYLLRVTGRSSDAEDLSQETFLRAFRALGSLSPEANERAWLFTIATNLTRNHFRSEARRRRSYAVVADEGRVGTDAGPERDALLAESRERIEGLIAGLPMRQRLAFTLRKFHDLEYAAIGDTLRCSADTARAHVFQAFRKIRKAMSKSETPKTEARR